MSSRQRTVGNILIVLAGVMLLGSAAAKVAHVPKVVSEMATMGFDGNKLMFVAFLEVISALLFLIPVTRSAGLLLVSSFMGGAIATHLQHGQPIVQPSLVLIMVWIGALLRHRDVLWSFGSFAAEMNRRRNASVSTGAIKAEG